VTSVHLTNAYHASSGGIRTFYRALLAAAPVHRRRVCLIVPGAKEGVEDVNAFARVYFVRAVASPIVDRRYRLILPHKFLLPPLSRIWGILDAERPDLVEVCDKYSLCYLAGILRKTRACRPALVGLSCERMDDNVRSFVRDAPAAARFARWYIREIYGPQFDAHIANSEYTASELEPHNPRHPRPVFVRHMGVDTTTFTAARADAERRRRRRAALGAGPHDPLLFFAGRLSAEKHAPLLLDMMRELPVARGRLVIAGDGPLRPEMERRAASELAGRVHFLSTITDRGALADWLTDVDLFVHPNPREPFGIAPLEAMAAGLPVVVPDRGGVRAYASHVNAWLAGPDGSGLAAAVVRALVHRDERDRRRSRALETAAAHAWPAAAARFFDLYDQLALRHSRPFRAQQPGAAPLPVRRSRETDHLEPERGAAGAVVPVVWR